MTSDLDIYRSAAVLVREHGEDAVLEAAQRAGAMLDKIAEGPPHVNENKPDLEFKLFSTKSFPGSAES